MEILLENEKKARELVLGRSLYQVVNGVLYHMESNRALYVIPPACDREQLFQEVHSGVFGAHMNDAKNSWRTVKTLLVA